MQAHTEGSYTQFCKAQGAGDYVSKVFLMIYPTDPSTDLVQECRKQQFILLLLKYFPW